VNFAPELLAPLVMGGGCIGYSIIEYRRIRSVRDWLKIPARILRSYVARVMVDIGEGEVERFKLEVLYEYKFQGQSLRANTLCLDEDAYLFTTLDRANKAALQFRAGQDLEIFCSVLGQVALFADIDIQRKSHYAAWFSFGLLIALVTPFTLWYRG
jgi:hypothetical protein